MMGDFVFLVFSTSTRFTIVNRKLLRRKPMLSMCRVNVELPKECFCLHEGRGVSGAGSWKKLCLPCWGCGTRHGRQTGLLGKQKVRNREVRTEEERGQDKAAVPFLGKPLVADSKPLILPCNLPCLEVPWGPEPLGCDS